MKLLKSLITPTYLYVIESTELGLAYVGIRTARFAEDDAYQGSSELLNAYKKFLPEFNWKKHLVSEFNSVSLAQAVETALINQLRIERPEGLINRSANNSLVQWEPTGYGSVTDKNIQARINEARKFVRRPSVFNGVLKNLVITKSDDETSHAPCMPSINTTPEPWRGNWKPELLSTYLSLPKGSYHFACEVLVRNGKRSYQPFALVESFSSEHEARKVSSLLNTLSEQEYKDYLFELLGESH